MGEPVCFYVFIRSPHPAGVLSVRETHRRGSKLDVAQHSMVGSEALWVDDHKSGPYTRGIMRQETIKRK